MDKLITMATRKKLLEVSESVAKNSEEALLGAIDYRRNKKIEIDDENKLLNLLEFILLLNFELSCLIRNMINSNSKLAPNLYARHILLIVHESTLTLRSLLANQFKSNYNSILNRNDILSFKSIHSKICKLHDKTAKKFGKVRNGITAHKDQNPETRIKMIEESDIRGVTDLVLEFFPLILAMKKPLTRYVENIKN